MYLRRRTIAGKQDLKCFSSYFFFLMRKLHREVKSAAQSCTARKCLSGDPNLRYPPSEAALRDSCPLGCLCISGSWGNGVPRRWPMRWKRDDRDRGEAV